MVRSLECSAPPRTSGVTSDPSSLWSETCMQPLNDGVPGAFPKVKAWRHWEGSKHREGVAPTLSGRPPRLRRAPHPGPLFPLAVPASNPFHGRLLILFP